MNYRVFLCGCVVLVSQWMSTVQAQVAIEKRQLEHADYDRWQTMAGYGLSRDGNWVWFRTQNGAVDGEADLTIRNLSSDKQYQIPRGTRLRFTPDSRFAIYQITPNKKELKRLRKQKTKAKDLPKSVFQILELASGHLTAIDHATSFRIPAENSDWVAFVLNGDNQQAKAKSTSATIKETYEVTPEGLRRPTKKPKLKKRESLENQPATTASTGVKKQEKSKAVHNLKSTTESSSLQNKTTAGGAVGKQTKKAKKKKTIGKPLLLINLDSGVRRTYPFVTEFAFSKFGDTLAFATSVNQSPSPSTVGSKGKSSSKAPKKNAPDLWEPVDGVTLVKLASLKREKIAAGTGQYKNLAFTEDGSKLAFLTNRDDYTSKTSAWSVYLWRGRGSAKKVAVEGDQGVPQQWWIATNANLVFSKDCRRLYFETAPIPAETLKERKMAAGGKQADDEPDDAQAKLDIWHWQDPQLQPQQLLQAAAERARDYRAVYNLGTKKIYQLATPEVPVVSINPDRDTKRVVANTNVEYRKSLSWQTPGFQDVWIVDVANGKREKILEKVKFRASGSPSGRYVVWFDQEEKHWFAKPCNDSDAAPVQMSEGIEYPLYNELHDTPNLPRSYGAAGWTTDDQFLVYDRYDIWQLDPSGENAPKCLTQQQGREKQITFRRVVLDREQRTIDLDQSMMLSGFDRRSRASGYWSLEINERTNRDAKPDDSETVLNLKPLIMLDESVSGLRKAKDSNAIVFTRNTFAMSNDLWSSDLSFKKISRVSDINPQQDDYAWGTAEIVNWDATDGQPLEGLLYKPDNFDPAKKYPMLVYFYERNSDNLHRYYAPSAGRSIINFSFYVSRGYVVFVPDIPYQTGQPGPSAANSILPGVQSLIETGFIDENRIGMQGHSWGGYQTAYLVTQTNLFACAESGAPVSNMTSAYGGIRWASGMSRMFQYERTQSRIGDDLWSARENYINNSPIFFADKIETPLLILHNDQDGAVPWYQGIELFVALRRLEKPAWMLNYNGNPHWVMGQANRRDFAKRMQQFFDHYLLDAPEPEWMAVGVPAVKKGKEFGFSLLEPKPEEPNEAQQDE